MPPALAAADTGATPPAVLGANPLLGAVLVDVYSLRMKFFTSRGLFPGSAGILPAFGNERSHPKPVCFVLDFGHFYVFGIQVAQCLIILV